MKDIHKAMKAAFPHTVPVMMGYLFLGFAFGVLMQSKGFSFIWAVLMSLLIYAGSMQFVAINFLTGGTGIISIIMLTLMVNIRHVFYGLAMLTKFRDIGKKKPYLIFALTDETFSLLCSAEPPQNVNKNWFLFWIAFLDQIYWITGTALGGILGSILPFNTKGIDFAMTALFVVIFVEQWKSSKNHIPALTGLIGSALCLAIFGASNFILPAMILIVIIMTVCRGRLEEVQ